MHIRFRKSFASYEQGKSYQLPEELASSYINAGVAEVVDYVPAPVPEEEEHEKPVREQHDDTKHKRKSK